MGGEFPQTSDGDIMRRLTNILVRAHKTNDYKFALAGFLLDYSKTNGGGWVSYDTVARHMLNTYWNQTRLRHSRNDPGKNVSVITSIMERNLNESYRPSIGAIEKEDPGRIERCADEMIRTFFRYVIPRFQRVEGTSIRELGIIFEWSPEKPISYKQEKGDRIPLDRESGMVINPDAVRVINANRERLSCTLTREWARFLEDINPGVPNILKKVEGTVRRTSLAAERRILERHFGLECFYCRKEFDDMSDMDADHVLPFMYMGEDELWNLVLAGRWCNNSKRARLPKEKYIDKLKDRNECGRSGIPELRKSVNRLGGDMGFITKHYRIAIDSGLGMWDGSGDCAAPEAGAWRQRGRRPGRIPPPAPRSP